MNSVTIGQYIPGNSWIYKLDPRFKILLTIFWIVLLFLVPLNIYAMIATLGVMILITISTRVPFIKMIKGMKPVIFLMIFTFVLQNIYVTPSENSQILATFDFKFGLYPLLIVIGIVLLYLFTSKHVPLKMIYLLVLIAMCFVVQSTFIMGKLNLSSVIDNFTWNAYKINIYDTSLLNATSIVIRIICMLMITSLLTFTTRYQEINQGFTSILSPLKLFHIPVATFAMMLSLSLRFIPTLVSETDKIMKAQASRGVDFAEANLKQKVNQIISLLVPLFVVSFRKADDLANAMEARGYIMDQKRTSIDELKLSWRDFAVGAMSLVVLAGVIVARIYI